MISIRISAGIVATTISVKTALNAASPSIMFSVPFVALGLLYIIQAGIDTFYFKGDCKKK
jgi:hypothetical protein